MIKNCLKIVIALLSLFLVVLIIAPSAFSGVLLGPKKYQRTSGSPNTYTDTFQAAAGSGSLIIHNGDSAGNNRVSSAVIYLNGKTIFSPSDFNQKVYNLQKSVQLNSGTNAIVIELRSKPGSYITVAVVDMRSIDLTITSPSDGASVIGSSVMVKGTVVNYAGAETGVTVNGVIATLFNNEFAVNQIPPTEGLNKITVSATDADGTTVKKSITVNAANAINYIKLSAYPESGTAPLEVTLKINGTFSITNPAITATGPGAVEQIAGTNPDEYIYKLNTEGIYYFTVQAIGPDENTYSDTIAVTALSLAFIDAKLKNIWQAMKEALSQQDIDGAILYFTSDTQGMYKKLFSGLEADLPNIVNELNTTQINLISLKNNKAIYEIVVARDGNTYSFPLQFRQDNNGIWKIRRY